MGQCSCNDDTLTARFPGNGAFTYTLSIYTGCESCGTGPRVIIHRMTPWAAAKWNVRDLPELSFGDDSQGVGEVPIWVVSPDLLAARLHMFDAENPGEYEIEGFIDDGAPNALRAACYDTFEKWALDCPWLRAEPSVSTPPSVYRCPVCGSEDFKINLRHLKDGTRLWYSYCQDCQEEGGDHRSPADALEECRCRPAEANVAGILRGGHVCGANYVFHGPSLTVVKLKTVRGLKYHNAGDQG